jgi:hypothetical protein
MLGALLLGGGLLDRVGQLHGGLLGAHPGHAGRQRRPLRCLHSRRAERVDHQYLSQPGAVGDGGPQQVGLDRGGQQRPRPLQHPRDHQRRGLEAPRGPEDQDRVAVLGGQQPPHDARGAAQDHPAGLGLADGEQPQLPTAGPHRAGMLGRPGVAGPVAGGATGQVPQDRGGAARDAADQAGEGGVHAGRTGQRRAHVGGPGQGGVAPVLR